MQVSDQLRLHGHGRHCDVSRVQWSSQKIIDLLDLYFSACVCPVCHRYPIDTLRRRYLVSCMLASMTNTPPAYSGVLDCAITVLRSEGLSGLCSGVFANTFRGLASALVLTLCDSLIPKNKH
jgi:hypothetical protein